MAQAEELLEMKGMDLMSLWLSVTCFVTSLPPE